MIHRDIKPENILLTRDGTTLVADFGIARALDAEDNLTRSGVTIGTPLYMSPEQTDDTEIDARADLYSLASVLYEMLAGEPPFTGRSMHAIVAKRLSDPTPSVTSAPGGCPGGGGRGDPEGDGTGTGEPLRHRGSSSPRPTAGTRERGMGTAYDRGRDRTQFPVPCPRRRRRIPARRRSSWPASSSGS